MSEASVFLTKASHREAHCSLIQNYLENTGIVQEKKSPLMLIKALQIFYSGPL
jgi:hypothetical protein